MKVHLDTHPPPCHNEIKHVKAGIPMIYFTADLHLGHRGIITSVDRPFDSVEAMNRTLIRNFNAVVTPRDTVYILGDLCHHLDLSERRRMAEKLHGRKILIRGNHDRDYGSGIFEEVLDFTTLSAEGHSFVLMHYPMLDWPKKKAGSIQLHGHIHSTGDINAGNRAKGVFRYDVGVDANYYFPVSAKQIIDFFGLAK